MSGPGPLIEFSINGVRGVLAFGARPAGASFDLVGDNGTGKTSTIDALWWGLGGQLDGEIVRNGSEEAETEILFGEYRVRRVQARGKPARLTVASADGKAKFASPTALLAGFREAIGRLTFSTMPTRQRADVIRKLAPGLDVGDLVAKRQAAYDDRTAIGRVGESLKGQLDGVVVPPDIGEIGNVREVADVVDVAEIAARKAPMEREIAANREARERAKRARQDAVNRAADVETQIHEVSAAKEALALAERILDDCRLALAAANGATATAEERAAALIDPDPSSIDAEITTAKRTNAEARATTEAHNAAVRQRQQTAQTRASAEKQRADLDTRLKAERASYAAKTKIIDALDKECEERIAAAAKALPVAGIALADGVVTFDDGTHGPVEIDSLNTALRFALDVELAAAQGHRIVAVRDASLLGKKERSKIDALAGQRGIQLVCEVIRDGAPLEAEIVEEAQS